MSENLTPPRPALQAHSRSYESTWIDRILLVIRSNHGYRNVCQIKGDFGQKSQNFPTAVYVWTLVHKCIFIKVLL